MVRMHAALVALQLLLTLLHAPDKYVDTLRSLGLQVLLLDADEAHPDCCFVEDTAVCIDRTALITFPGHDSRVGETAAVERALVDLAGMRVVRMKRPARMDGASCVPQQRMVLTFAATQAAMSCSPDRACMWGSPSAPMRRARSRCS